MKRLLLLTALLIFISSFSAYAQAQRTQATVIGKYANVYEEPNGNSQRLRTLTKNVKVVLIKDDGEWCLIEVYGKQGWTETKHLKISGRSNAKKVTVKKITQPKKKRPVTKKKNKSNLGYKTWELGFTVGMNSSGLYGDDIVSYYSRRAAYRVGGLVRYNFNRYFGIQAELLYSAEGARGELLAQDAVMKLDYIQLPILLKINSFRFNERVEGFWTLGPKVGYLMNAAVVSDDDTYTLDDSQKIDVGANAGFGISFNKSDYKFSLEYRVGAGFLSIHDHEDPLDMKNYGWSLIYGMTF